VHAATAQFGSWRIELGASEVHAAKATSHETSRARDPAYSPTKPPVSRAFATKRSLPDNKSALVVMAQSAARPIRRMQRARRSGLEFDVMIVFVVLF
jgi:hypothetical protein